LAVLESRAVRRASSSKQRKTRFRAARRNSVAREGLFSGVSPHRSSRFARFSEDF
jgi:hypothetical protein